MARCAVKQDNPYSQEWFPSAWRGRSDLGLQSGRQQGSLVPSGSLPSGRSAPGSCSSFSRLLPHHQSWLLHSQCSWSNLLQADRLISGTKVLSIWEHGAQARCGSCVYSSKLTEWKVLSQYAGDLFFLSFFVFVLPVAYSPGRIKGNHASNHGSCSSALSQVGSLLQAPSQQRPALESQQAESGHCPRQKHVTNSSAL